MQRTGRLAQGLGLLARSYSAAAEPAQALRPAVQEEGVTAAISALKQRLAAGRAGKRAALAAAAEQSGTSPSVLALLSAPHATFLTRRTRPGRLHQGL